MSEMYRTLGQRRHPWLHGVREALHERTDPQYCGVQRSQVVSVARRLPCRQLDAAYLGDETVL